MGLGAGLGLGVGLGLGLPVAAAESRSDMKLDGEKGVGLSARFAGASREGAVVKVSFGLDST